ncbi:MAG: hypothetical protein GY811_08905 [Myxococcales bacterium]|nr:hypothetical protein [Myxococcales bacterium]
MAAGALYGVSDKIQVGALTPLGIDPNVEWGENLNLSGHYLVHDSEKLDVAAGVGIPLNFGDRDVLPGFTVDANTRYIVNDKIWVNTGNSLLAIAIDPSAINLNMNVGGAFQATEQLSVGLGTQLASIVVSGDGNETTTVGDFIPLSKQSMVWPRHRAGF